MDKRQVTKAVAKILVSTTTASFVTKTMLANVPSSENLKIAEMTGVFAGWAVGEKLGPKMDEMIDNFYDRREAKRKS